MTTTPSLLLLSVVALLGLGTAESAKVKIAGGDVVLTDRLARTIQVMSLPPLDFQTCWLTGGFRKVVMPFVGATENSLSGRMPPDRLAR